MTSLHCRFERISPTRDRCTTCGALFHASDTSRSCHMRPSQAGQQPSARDLRPFEIGMMRKSGKPGDR